MPDPRRSPSLYERYLALIDTLRQRQAEEFNQAHEPLPGEEAQTPSARDIALGATLPIAQPMVRPSGQDIDLSNPSGRMGPAPQPGWFDTVYSTIIDPTKRLREGVREAAGTPPEGFHPVDALGLLSLDPTNPGGPAPVGQAEAILPGAVRAAKGAAAEVSPIVGPAGEALEQGTGRLMPGVAGAAEAAAPEAGAIVKPAEALVGPAGEALERPAVGNLTGPTPEPPAVQLPSARQMKADLFKDGGYTIDTKTGERATIGSPGTMVALHPNTTTDKVMIIPQSKFKPSMIAAYRQANEAELEKEGRYLGMWLDKDKNGVPSVYLDTPKRVIVEPTSQEVNAVTAAKAKEIRQATKIGEGKQRLNPNPDIRAAGKQKAVFDLTAGKDLPVRNWLDFLTKPLNPKDPLQRSAYDHRAAYMEAKGNAYLQTHGGKQWWDLGGSDIERVYGKPMMRRVAGYIASTSPQTDPSTNLRIATEYIRRDLAGEPILQNKAGYEIPTLAEAGAKGGSGPWQGPGTEQISGAGQAAMSPFVFDQKTKQWHRRGLPMEGGRTANLLAASHDELEKLSADKVNEMAQAMLGNPNVIVADTHHAKLAESPATGAFLADVFGQVPPKEYALLRERITGLAARRGISTRDYAANVWTGIRETINETGQLYGTPFKRSPGESYGFNVAFDKMVAQKAAQLHMTVPELEALLSKGDANLLAALLSTGVGLEVLRRSQQRKGTKESIGTLATTEISQ